MPAEQGASCANRSKLSDRYNLEHAYEPANGRGLPPRSSNAFSAVATVAITDPIPDPETGLRGRQIATVNRRVDLLEWERSHDRISSDAYAVGRIVQAVFERSRGPGCGSQWQQGDRVDAAMAHELAIIYSIEDARRIKAMVDGIVRDLGMIDARIVRRILGDRMTYAEVAALQGKSGERGTAYIAQRFRDALEALAERRAARGRG